VENPKIDILNNKTYILLEIIRNDLNKFLDKKIINKELSNYLNQNDRYIDIKYYRMRRGEAEDFKYNTFILIKNSIQKVLRTNLSNELKQYFKTYEEYIKTLKNYEVSHKLFMKFHPFANINYFQNIDTKEKAYWLGFIYADGTILRLINKERNNKITDRFKLSQNKKDRILIYRFTRTIGLNIKQINYDEESDSFEIKFRCHQIIDDLKKHRVFYRKSKKIILPNLKTKELYLSFLLGYFDGDGEAGSTRIHSGSLVFLNQIKELFNIGNKIQEKSKLNKKGKKQIWYALSLGANLFNTMLDNYTRSLKRKRTRFVTNMKDFHYAKFVKSLEKLSFSKDELVNLLSKLPKYKVCKKLEVSQYYLNKLIKYWDI